MDYVFVPKFGTILHIWVVVCLCDGSLVDLATQLGFFLLLNPNLCCSIDVNLNDSKVYGGILVGPFSIDIVYLTLSTVFSTVSCRSWLSSTKADIHKLPVGAPWQLLVGTNSLNIFTNC